LWQEYAQTGRYEQDSKSKDDDLSEEEKGGEVPPNASTAIHIAMRDPLQQSEAPSASQETRSSLLLL